MSLGDIPASSQAALMASHASWSSLRPESQENSVSADSDDGGLVLDAVEIGGG